jgi:hypothetical protein
MSSVEFELSSSTSRNLFLSLLSLSAALFSA